MEYIDKKTIKMVNENLFRLEREAKKEYREAEKKENKKKESEKETKWRER